MSMSPLTLSSDKSDNYVAGVTIRRGDEQGQMDVTVLDANNSPYDLTNAVMTFYDKKDNGSKMMDSDQGHFNIDDATHGHFFYKLQKQAGYIGSGAAWFEFRIGEKVDTTQNFYITVSADLDMTISTQNYISAFDGLKSKMQTIVDNADKELADKLKAAQQALDSQLDSMKQSYSQLSKNLQDSFDSAENDRKMADQKAEAGRQSEYQSDKKKRDDQYTADKQQRDADYQADKDKRNSDFASQQDTINKAASDQRDTITQQWSAKQTQLVQDWTAKRETLDTELNELESTVNALQTAVDQLNQTDLPNAQQKMDALNDEIKKAEQTFSQVDFSKFATTDELAAKQDKIGYKPADDSQVVHSTVTDLKSTDMNTVITAGFYLLRSGTNGIPGGDDHTLYQVIPYWSSNGVQIAYGTNSVILGMRSWRSYNQFTSWTQFADDSKVAHLSGANNFDTVPTVNNNPLLLETDLTGYAKTADITPKLADATSKAETAQTAADKARQTADAALNSAKNYTDSKVSNINLAGYQKTWTGTLADYQSLTSYSDDTMYYILSGYDVVVK